MLNLTEDDLKRIDKEAVKELIKSNKKRLQTWSLTSQMKQEIEDEIKELQKLLK